MVLTAACLPALCSVLHTVYLAEFTEREVDLNVILLVILSMVLTAACLPAPCSSQSSQKSRQTLLWRPWCVKYTWQITCSAVQCNAAAAASLAMWWVLLADV
jgi:hypothetical protein